MLFRSVSGFVLPGNRSISNEERQRQLDDIRRAIEEDQQAKRQQRQDQKREKHQEAEQTARDLE